MRRAIMNRWSRLALSLLLWPVLFFIMFRWFEHAQVFQGSRRLHASGAELGRRFEDVRFRAEDGVDLHGWFFPSDLGTAPGSRVVLICHGNAGNISHRLELCRLLLELELSVFVFDYRGYGLSQGSPTEEGTYQDAVAAQAWLQAKAFTPDQIVLLGESLGGAVATELALRKPVLGVILVSTFTSIPDVGSDLFPWLPTQWLCRIRYETLKKLPRVGRPVLVMHSRHDSIIPYRHAEALFAAAPEPKTLWQLTGDHNDMLWVAPDRFQEGIRQFLRSLDSQKPAGR